MVGGPVWITWFVKAVIGWFWRPRLSSLSYFQSSGSLPSPELHPGLHHPEGSRCVVDSLLNLNGQRTQTIMS